MNRAAAAALALATACSGGDPGGATEGFPQPAGTAAVSFSVDDRLNQVFDPLQLEWKGAMIYDPSTRRAVSDATWAGPYAPLYDDGPWDKRNPATGQPGHEGRGATANDHILGATVFMKAPATIAEWITFGEVAYGLNDIRYDQEYGGGWLWPYPENGTFSLDINQRELILPVLVLPAFGQTDLRLTLDLAQLPAGWDTSQVEVKGSAWCWAPVVLSDDGTKGDLVAGDGIFTFVLSWWVGRGHPFNHTGLLASGALPEFIWMLGGVEYKEGGSVALTTGVGAEVLPRGGSWTPLEVLVQQVPNDVGARNSYVVVP